MASVRYTPKPAAQVVVFTTYWAAACDPKQPFGNCQATKDISTMNDYKASKPEPNRDFDSVAEYLSDQPEKLDKGFWKEYIYWSWRCLTFVLFMVFVTSMDFNESPIRWFDDISVTMWAVLILTPLLVGPLVFTGWSYVWMWGQDFFERIRQK